MNGHVYEVCYDCKVYTPSVKALSSHLKRAMDASTPATLAPIEWIASLAYFGGKCAYCRHRPIQVLEHFLPIALGGGTTADNCVPACHRCNIKKGVYIPTSYPLMISPLRFWNISGNILAGISKKPTCI